jgi:hypothetical protein
MTKKKRNRHGGGKVGHPRFEPTDVQRAIVTVLSGMHVNWDEIRKLIVNPETQRPIPKTTLNRRFRHELDIGSVTLKELIASKFVAALERNEPWAVKWGLRNRYHWVGEGSATVPVEVGEPSDMPNIQVTFVVPERQPEAALIDATPDTNPYQGAEPDYGRPAIEGPRPRERTPTGAVYERPRGGSDWMD